MDNTKKQQLIDRLATLPIDEKIDLVIGMFGGAKPANKLGQDNEKITEEIEVIKLFIKMFDNLYKNHRTQGLTYAWIDYAQAGLAVSLSNEHETLEIGLANFAGRYFQLSLFFQEIKAYCDLCLNFPVKEILAGQMALHLQQTDYPCGCTDENREKIHSLMKRSYETWESFQLENIGSKMTNLMDYVKFYNDCIAENETNKSEGK